MAEVEVDEVLCLCACDHVSFSSPLQNPKLDNSTKSSERGRRTVSNETAKVPANDTVPRRALAVIKRLLDVLRDVLLDVELEHRLLRCGGLVRGSSAHVRPWHHGIVFGVA